jgi:AraC family transcriptional activator of pobA
MKKIPVRHINSAGEHLGSSFRFSIRKVQDLAGEHDLFHHLHRHDFYFILAVRKGEGIHEIDFVPYNVADHSIFILRPGQVHQLELKKGASGFLMEFDAQYFHQNDKATSQQLRKWSNENFCQLDVTRFDKLYAVLDYIFQESWDKQEGYNDIIKANLNIFFIEIARQSTDPDKRDATSSYTQQRLEELLALLEVHVTKHKRVADYQDLMNLSAYQLNEITKTSLGKTPSELINEHTILEAKRYLKATTSQIKDIADLLGYEDVSYFVRFFKRHTGYSPEAFRHN